MKIPVGPTMLGRVVNPFMEPIDGQGAYAPEEYVPILRPPIGPLQRGRINQVFSTGVRSLDGLLTCGKGQKMGIFAGSGVGKSTLMGMIVKGSDAPVKVVALIGERGREIPEFIQNNLGNDLTDTVIVAATSDDSALMRKYGACSLSWTASPGSPWPSGRSAWPWGSPPPPRATLRRSSPCCPS